MIPLKLTLSGFMSYRDEQTLDFKDDSLWVLMGKNASGKSSIFDAIIFVLFGETRVSGIPNAELVNHHSDFAQITFDFAVGEKLYRVKRTIDQKGNTTRQASILLIKPDGSLAPQPIPGSHTSSGIKKWIENDIGLNYEVFITSVLLRQGKADAFLEAGTDTRYDVLSKLIDLSKYAALEGKAREQKRFWEAQATFHRENLSRMSPVTEQDLSDAQITIGLESEAVTAAQVQVDHLQILYGQASQWGHLNADLLTTGEKIAQHQSLLGRSEEINKCYRRLVDLRRELPGLKAIYDLAEAIRLEDDEVRRLSEEARNDEERIRSTETSVGELNADFERKANRVREITDESNQMYRRLSELSPVMSLINQVDQLRRTLEAHRISLAKYPGNLDDLVKESETKRDQLQEAQRAIPGLSRLAAERVKLLEAEQRRIHLTQTLSTKEASRPGILQAKEDAQAGFEKAETHEKNMRDALTRAKTLLGSARKRMEDFNQVAGRAKCQYCGSDLTEEHKARERQRLTGELADMNTLVATAQGDHSRAAEALVQADEQRRLTGENLRQLDAEIGSLARDLERCEQDIRERLAAIGMTYDALPDAYQKQICLSKPASIEAWAETIYPQNGNLEDLRTAVKNVSHFQAEVTRLSKLVEQRNQTRALWTNAGETVKEIEASLPADWEELQAEHQRLSETEGEVSDRLEAAQQEQADAHDGLEGADRALQEMRNRQNRRSGTLETTRITLQRNRRSLEAQTAQMPESWQAEADTVTEGKLATLSAEMSNLQEYEDLHQQLAAANQTLRDLCAHQVEVQAIIDTLPVETHRPAEQVGQELSDARESSRQAEGRQVEAQNRLTHMQRQRDQYKEAEDGMKAADRKAHLYGILSEQFGEKGIQKAIINRAEVAIVRLSNQMLDNLSGGRSKLRLREAGGNKKALDLEVWDSQTGGDKPILASLASGSQRFRIAISLALGIGQYIGNESNRIESVIIDEGFGSLDREGRESIIQELYNLRQHLKRIILVSHQEEFSRGFSTGYEIQLIDGASQVKPLVQ